MRIEASRKFIKLYGRMPAEIQSLARKVIAFLQENPGHPSLENKKMTGYGDIYEIRVNINYRITYKKIGDTAILRKIGTHNLLRSP